MLKVHASDWVTQGLIIPCNGAMRDQILSVDTWEMLDHFPEAYWVLEEIQPFNFGGGAMAVAINGPLAFDLRNLQTLRDWTWSPAEGQVLPLTHDLWILDVEGIPERVEFYHCGELYLRVYPVLLSSPTQE